MDDNVQRSHIIVRTSALGVGVNVALALAKVTAGLAAASSIAIVSEGVNNAADALTSVLTLVGARLASRHPDAEHPFGYGRIEYLTALVVSVVIFVSGAQMMRESIQLILHPEPLAISYVSLAVVAISAVVKFLLAVYTIRKGRSVSSDALVGVGTEGRADAFVSVVTIGVAIVFLATGLSLDAWAGIVMSLVILKAGYEVLMKTASELIGRPGERELATKIYSLVRATPGVVGAADMMLHNYGPNAWSGSVNIEIDHARTVGETYAFLHKLQLRIMHELQVTMVFGIYAVDNDHEAIARVRKAIGDFIRQEKDLKSFHAVYLDSEAKRLYCDIVASYDLKDWDAMRTKFEAYMRDSFPGYEVDLTLETEFV